MAAGAPLLTMGSADRTIAGAAGTGRYRISFIERQFAVTRVIDAAPFVTAGLLRRLL